MFVSDLYSMLEKNIKLYYRITNAFNILIKKVKKINNYKKIFNNNIEKIKNYIDKINDYILKIEVIKNDLKDLEELKNTKFINEFNLLIINLNKEYNHLYKKFICYE